MTPAAASLMLDAALAYASEGLRPFPLAPNDKVPLIPKSLGGNGCHDGTTDEAQIRRWWSKCPNANIGVATGGGLLVVDLDGDEGCLSLIALCEQWEPLPVTRCVSTGRPGGFHFWFRATGPSVRNSTGTRNGIAPGIDTRGEGGYVVAPPSIHPSGLAYKSSPTAPIAGAPAWLLDLLTPKIVDRTGPPVSPTISTTTTPYGRRAIELECERVRTTPKGDRNEQLNASAFALGQLEGGGEIAEGDAGPALEEAALAAGLPSGQSWKTIYKSGLIKGRAKPRKAPETARRLQSRGQRPEGSTARALERITSKARTFARADDRNALAALISALGGDAALTLADPESAVTRGIELARIAAEQKRGDLLAAGLRIAASHGRAA